MRSIIAIAAGVGVLASSGSARASDRLAVALLVEGQPRLADDLTEIAIARLAEQRGDLVGLRELRGRMLATMNGESIDVCLAAGRCLEELARASGADHAVIGRMAHAPDGTWRFEVGLADTRAGTVAWRPPRSLPIDTDAVLAGISAAIDDLMARESPPAPKAPSPVPSPRAAPIVARSELAAPERPRSAGHRARLVGGWGMTGLSAAALVSAAILGHSAGLMPTGPTRADAQADLSRREGQAQDANTLWIVGGVLAAASAGVLLWRW